MLIDGMTIRRVTGDADKAGMILCGSQCTKLLMEHVHIRANASVCCEKVARGELPPGTCCKRPANPMQRLFGLCHGFDRYSTGLQIGAVDGRGSTALVRYAVAAATELPGATVTAVPSRA